MMLKVIVYAHKNNLYSCSKIEKQPQRDIHYIWLAAQERPDYVTVDRFGKLVLLLADRGFISLDVEYIDGTKIESKANKYTFVWRRTVEKNRAKLQGKVTGKETHIAASGTSQKTRSQCTLPSSPLPLT